MLTVRELRSLARSLTAERFEEQLGPFVLTQRPPELEVRNRTDLMGLPVNAAKTELARPEDISAHSLSLIFEFDDLMVATLPPLREVDELTVGRQPDSDLVLNDASVSKRHAVLRWDAAVGHCSIEDLGSTNGTVLNASVVIRRETVLRDGDILSFGDVPFWFLLTRTLHKKLGQRSGVNQLGSRSG